MSSTILDKLINDFSTDHLLRFFVEYKDLRDFVPASGIDRDFSDFDTENFVNGQKIGEITYSTTDKLMAFAFKVNKPLTERSGKKAQFDLAKQVLRSFNNIYDGIFVFYDKQGNFRFSLIYVNFYGKRTKLSNFRRFTYYVSTQDNRTNKTFRQRMERGDFTSLEGIKEAFAVEPVTKAFYKDISNWYDWALKNVKFPDEAEKQKNGREHAVIRLITRMIFIWFMREKGFISKKLFDENEIKNLLISLEPKDSSYYHAILQNLFFSTLSTEVPNRKYRKDAREYKNFRDDYGKPGILRYKEYFKNQEKIPELFENIPFLNGGLFSCLDLRKAQDKEIEKDVFIDGFSDNPKFQASVPNELFFGEDRNIDLNEIYDTKDQRYNVRGLINTLSQFNFTIDENTPDDQDIALDPELLGHVFENLLARVNPETSEQARRETGSFYTPRHIVDFMVDEALVASLDATLQRQIPSALDTQSRIKSLVSYHDDTPRFNEAEKKVLVKHIDQIKIIDPACGSGAFPMGALNKLVYILAQLDPENTIWKDFQYQKAIDAIEHIGQFNDEDYQNQRIQEIEKVFSEDVDKDYGRKLYLIRNCIYGVDIQPIAAQISKLRFFISLIVEQSMNPNAKEDNFGIIPLPNLETKIVTANSLLSLRKGTPYAVPKPVLELPSELKQEVSNLKRQLEIYLKVSTPSLKERAIQDAMPSAHKINAGMKHVPEFEPLSVKEIFESAKFASDLEKYLPIEKELEQTQSLFGQEDIHTLEAELKQIHELHFQASNPLLRDKYEKKDKAIRAKLAKALESSHEWGAKNDTLASKLLAWNPFDQNSVAPFFDPGWMFDVHDGFDIVIGNPPYIQLQSLAKSAKELQKSYQEAGYKTHDSMGDMYCLFYELGYNLLKWNTGILSYITSNKWMRAGYGKRLRDFFAEFTNPLLLIDFAGQKVFDTATVDVNILVFRKSKINLRTKSITITENCLSYLGDYIEQNALNIHYRVDEPWVILNTIEKSIKEKIESIGTPLQDWDIRINYGIKTGFNKAFIINSEVKDVLVKKDPKSAEIIRPILRGRDIKRYKFIFKDLFLICTFPSLKINIEDYPVIKQHLLSFGKDRLEQSGTEFYKNGVKISSRKKTQNKWYETQDTIAYWEDFNEQKIVYKDISQRLAFALAEPKFMINNTAYFISNHPNLLYLLGILNSDLIDWYYRTISVQLGEKAVRMFTIYVNQLPIPKLIFENTQEISNLSVKASNTNISCQERINIIRELELSIHNIYELTDKEKSLIANLK